MEIKNKISLFVTDIDNTLFDWVSYYVHSFGALLKSVEKTIQVPYQTLAAEAKVVFSANGSIEYPFLIQQLPSVIEHYGADIDAMLSEAVGPGRDDFLEVAENYFQPYETVPETLAKFRKDFPHVPMVALTDAPRYVAMWKMNKLGLLDYFDAIYGLPDPKIPTGFGRVKVDPEILLKHLQQSNFEFKGKIRVLPDEYEKPGTKGLKTVFIDFERDEDPTHRQEVIWIGDNLGKDVGLGKLLGVKTAWASYGAEVPLELLKSLGEFSPPHNIHKNVNLDPLSKDAPIPDVTLKKFADVFKLIY